MELLGAVKVVYGGVWFEKMRRWSLMEYGGVCMVVYGGVWWCKGGVWWCMV
jgi:hypothetical protein